MKCKTRGKEDRVALKLDVNNSFDRVKWSYLQMVMQNVGFSDTWIGWIMQCVTTVSYHVLLNNDRVGPIICYEELTAYIHSHECRGLIHGTRICRGISSISLLLFADDSFLLCKATLSKVTTLKHILDTYEATRGQAINYKKSAITYSRNTDA
jgi:hypothetical protein